MSGAASGANLATSTIGYVSKVTITGDMAGLSGISPGDVGWDFSECNKIETTAPHALTYLSTGATTAIATVSTPVVVNGAFTNSNSQLFTVS